MPTPSSPRQSPSPEAIAAGEALQAAVDKELDKKRKLGHYYVWATDDGCELIGPDAPRENGDEGK